MKTSWEPASTLPDSLIKDYEKGACGDVLESFSSGGQTIHTMSISPSGDEPKSKKIKSTEVGSCTSKELGNDTRCVQLNYVSDMSHSITYSRFFADTEEDHSIIVCNTEKDKARVNYRTAGIIYLRPTVRVITYIQYVHGQVFY